MGTGDLIRQLRLTANASQQQTAVKLGMARATYATLEDGREPKLRELQALAQLYNVTLDELANGTLTVSSPNGQAVSFDEPADAPARDVNPTLKPEKLREVLLYLTNRIGAKANVGETVLYKLLYFIDFDFYEKYGQSITGLTYIKLAHGPVPQQQAFSAVVAGMKTRQEMEIVKTEFFSHDQKKYLPLKSPFELPLAHLSAQELEHINWEIDRLSDKTASQLSDFSHYDMPWLAAREGQPLNYQHVFYRSGITAVTEPSDDL